MTAIRPHEHIDELEYSSYDNNIPEQIDEPDEPSPYDGMSWIEACAHIVFNDWPQEAPGTIVYSIEDLNAEPIVDPNAESITEPNVDQ